jgi:uncharacterized membrane protein YkvA (DUF1232 family)
MPQEIQEIPEIQEVQTEQKKPLLKQIGHIGVIILSAIYLINPTGGVIEILPDVIPIAGNLDEATVTAAMLWSIQQMRKGKGE